jgi:hypothetical protein
MTSTAAATISELVKRITEMETRLKHAEKYEDEKAIINWIRRCRTPNKKTPINWDAIKSALGRASKNTICKYSKKFYARLLKEFPPSKSGTGILGEYLAFYEKVYDNFSRDDDKEYKQWMEQYLFDFSEIASKEVTDDEKKEIQDRYKSYLNNNGVDDDDDDYDTPVDWKERFTNLQDLILIEPNDAISYKEILERFPPEDSPTRFKTLGEYLDFENDEHEGSCCLVNDNSDSDDESSHE